jgi:hypothetical protein
VVYVIVLVLLLGIVWLVGGPLLRSGSGSGAAVQQAERDQLTRSERRIDLEAARDAKYREIRDAELDHQTGKLSDEDFSAIDGNLRAEAMELLHELDAVDALDVEAASAHEDELDDRPATPERE